MTKLSELLDRAAAGEEIVTARHGRPIARLVAYPQAPRDRPTTVAAMGASRQIASPDIT